MRKGEPDTSCLPGEHPVGVEVSLEASSSELNGELPVAIGHGLRDGLSLANYTQKERKKADYSDVTVASITTT